MTYKKASLEVVEFNIEDVIVTSGADVVPPPPSKDYPIDDDEGIVFPEED